MVPPRWHRGGGGLMTDTGTMTSNPVIKGLIAVGGMVVVVGIIVFFSTLIWPGQATITRHVLCDDGHPDAYVVRSTRAQTGIDNNRGTAVDFRLMCVSSSGVSQNQGWARP